MQLALIRLHNVPEGAQEVANIQAFNLWVKKLMRSIDGCASSDNVDRGSVFLDDLGQIVIIARAHRFRFLLVGVLSSSVHLLVE